MDPNSPKPLFSFSQNDAGSGVIRGSIAERRAAKCGFKAERISTPRFRTTSPLTSPAPAGVRSPCITIPPGISPTALLDSPIMLPNAQPSPTTGTFPLPHLNYGSTMLNTVIPADVDMNNGPDTFRFKPYTGSFVGFASGDDQGQGQGQGNNGDFQSAVDFEFPVEFSNEARIESLAGDSATDLKALNSMNANANLSDMQMSHTDAADIQTSRQTEPVCAENVCTHQPIQEEKETFPAIGIARNSEDGYNWRKYGQKQVKGSEYPRSYYKCTQPNCEVKKKIERSYDGQITEIIYKGTHNHPKPQPSRRTLGSAASSYDEMPEIDENSDRCVKGEVGSVWRGLQPGDVKHSAEWKLDGLERTSSASGVTELSDPLSTTQGRFDSVGTPDLSSTLVCNDDDDDGATQSFGADAEESESKRRKIENCLVETSLTSRAVREPRVVVQIESEIDILDDGYRWRKYGQKVVKGNPNPRSYYKCTSAGCVVRKHVERASHNLKFVITTYEGKHNHDVPAARNSSNNVNTTNNNLSHAPNNSQHGLTLPRNANGPKPERPMQDYASGYDRKPMINNDFLRPIFAGNFSNGLGSASSNYPPMKLPPTFQHTAPYGSFGQQLIRPKQEQRDENGFDAGQQSMMDHVNASASSSSSLYHHMMGNYPS
ncbi:WRKY DNA-binding protein 2 [Euphorbia peplus]|nr:WRKY DNA-binding protein 2 [Euphorbia peplus]